jgi:hypothetical protein
MVLHPSEGSRPLRSSWSDLAGYFAGAPSPFGITRIINCTPGRGPWEFAIRISYQQTIEIEIYPPDDIITPDLVSMALGGVIPELFDCDELEVSDGSTTLMARDLREQRRYDNYEASVAVETVKHWQGAPFIRMRGAYSDRLPASVHDVDAARSYLRRHTWMGSRKYATPARRVIWRVMAKALDVTSNELAKNAVTGDPSTPSLALKTERNGVGLSLIANPFQKASVYRLADFGESLPNRECEAIRESLRRRRLIHCNVELDAPGVYHMGALGLTVPAEDPTPFLDAACSTLRNANGIDEYLRKVADWNHKVQSDQLNMRIDKARLGEKVLWRDAFVALEPTSEQGTVALFAKLEGMGALPFHCVTRAWAAASGIDAIADIRVGTDTILSPEAPVEFEFLFQNFISHQHPHDHVKLVVCWRVASNDELESTGASWLRYLVSGNHRIPVAVVSEFPDITVGGK